MKNIKPVPILISFTAVVFAAMRFIGVSEFKRLTDAVPVFDGSGLVYGGGNYDTAGIVILCGYALLWLMALLFYILSKNHSLIKKLFIIPSVIFSGGLCLLTAAFLMTAPSADSFSDNYDPEYYVVYDRDKTVRLLFAEGMYFFDAVTEVYFLDDDDRAYCMGSFSADGVLQGGCYDVIRQGNTISFSYDYGTLDENKEPVFRQVTFELPHLTK